MVLAKKGRRGGGAIRHAELFPRNPDLGHDLPLDHVVSRFQSGAFFTHIGFSAPHAIRHNLLHRPLEVVVEKAALAAHSQCDLRVARDQRGAGQQKGYPRTR
jgi:hypothetical protein